MASLTVVAASTAALPWIYGYGTVLFQVVVLGAWSILARATSQVYADRHHGPMWAIALIVNVLLFAIPATVIWALSRNRWPRFSTYLLLGWAMFYLASLFVLFHATEGP